MHVAQVPPPPQFRSGLDWNLNIKNLLYFHFYEMTRAMRIKINAINKITYIWSIQFNICIQHYIPKFLSSTGGTKVHIWCSIRKQDRLKHTILQSLISQKQIPDIVNKRAFFLSTYTDKCKLDRRRVFWSGCSFYLALWDSSNSSDSPFGKATRTRDFDNSISCNATNSVEIMWDWGGN